MSHCERQPRLPFHGLAGVSTILVVDDDRDTRGLLKMILEIEGHAVIEAAHGAEALGLIGPKALPDVVVTELGLPVLGGVELIRRLQAEHRTATIPVVIVSADVEQVRTLADSGLVTAFVRKPFDAAEFAKCIRSLAMESGSSTRAAQEIASQPMLGDEIDHGRSDPHVRLPGT